MFLPDPCSPLSAAPIDRQRLPFRRSVMAGLAAGCAVGAVVVSAATADAHVTATPAQITAGVASAIQLTVEEGCGSLATIQLAVQLPAAFGTATAPVPPPGWTAEQVADVLTFRGPGLAPDAPFAVSFTVTVDAAVAGTIQQLPSVQRCDKQAVERWIDRVDAAHPEPDHPAPVVAVLAPPPPTTAATTVAPSTVATTGAPATTPATTSATTSSPAATTDATTAVAAPAVSTTAIDPTTTLVAVTAPAPPSGGSSGSAIASVVGVVAALSAAGGFAFARRRRPAGPESTGPESAGPETPGPESPASQSPGPGAIGPLSPAAPPAPPSPSPVAPPAPPSPGTPAS